MANIIGFGLDLAINVAVLAEAFGGRSSGPVAMVGTGSTALGSGAPSVPNKETPAGVMPALSLYDVHGQNFATDTAFAESMGEGDNKQVNFQGGLDNSNLDSDPEYMRLFAIEDDATCISYVTVTGVSGSHTSWHAGYAKQCNAAWYPSPELLPTTSFRPGCVWLTNQVDFPGLQAISFKLTDLSFQSDAESDAGKMQFLQFPETLCNAPGRMAFWKTADLEDCIPFYNFIEEKDKNTGFDTDFGKIQTGQTMSCTPTGSMFIPSDLPSSIAASSSVAPPPSSAAPPLPAPTVDGAGNFGGVLGEIPISEAGQPPAQSTQPPAQPTQPPAQPTQPPSQPSIFNAGDQGIIEVSFNPGGPSGSWEAVPQPTPTAAAKAKSRRLSTAHSTVLQRRAALKKKRDYCVDRLAISHLPGHSATEVCQSATSWGPDFVSVAEGLYCDMCERILWNLCAGPGLTYCFDLAARELRLPGGEGLEARDMDESLIGDKELAGLHKRYAKVDEWKE